MADSSSTCWTEIRGAADGDASDREAFARRYLPPVRAYLGARWRRSPLLGEVDDAAQEVFLECFRGALGRADPARRGGFRALLFGIARNVALRCEERYRRRGRELQVSDHDALPADDESLSDAFDRAWAHSIMAQARVLQAEQARGEGPEAQRRVELLRLRFEEERPIREIARLWQETPERLHAEYRRARREFKDALMQVVRFHQSGTDRAVEAECRHLLGFLS